MSTKKEMGTGAEKLKKAPSAGLSEDGQGAKEDGVQRPS